MNSYNERVEISKYMSPDVDRWIVSTPDTCSGSPRVRRTRLRVSKIVNMVKNGDEQELYEDYPYITKQAVDACIVYSELMYNEST